MREKIIKNENEKEEITKNLEEQKNEKQKKIETLNENKKYLPTKIVNQISKIENEDKKKSDSTDNELKLEFDDEIKKPS